MKVNIRPFEIMFCKKCRLKCYSVDYWVICYWFLFPYWIVCAPGLAIHGLEISDTDEQYLWLRQECNIVKGKLES